MVDSGDCHVSWWYGWLGVPTLARLSTQIAEMGNLTPIVTSPPAEDDVGARNPGVIA
jgi:hypothetical protein